VQARDIDTMAQGLYRRFRLGGSHPDPDEAAP